MRSTFKLLFYINRQKVKKNGKCPVMGRITLNGKVSQYSTGLEVEPAYWDADTGRASTDGRKESLDSEKKKELVRLNDALSALEAKACATYKENVDSYGFVSAEIIKNAVTGRSQVKETLLALMDEHNEEYAKRVGIDRTRHTYVRYLTTRKHIHNFMKYKYNMEDMPLRSLTMRFMTDFLADHALHDRLHVLPLHGVAAESVGIQRLPHPAAQDDAARLEKAYPEA